MDAAASSAARVPPPPPPRITTECVVEDVRRRCLTPECPYFAHPQPETDEIEDGYCCNACYGRSTGLFPARKGHYKHCLRAEHGTSRAAGGQESLTSRQPQKAPRRARNSSDDLASAPAKKLVITEAKACAPGCPECIRRGTGPTQMVWDTFAAGAYARGWVCHFYDMCGYQSFKLKCHTHCEPRWLCRKCEIDICDGCAAAGAAGGRGSRPSALRPSAPSPQSFCEQSARELRELKSLERK